MHHVGRKKGTMKSPFAALVASLSLASVVPSMATTLDSNFQETAFASVGSGVTGLAWAPDGSNRLFVSRKAGEIRVIKNGAVLATPFVTVNPIFLNAECGLVGFCFDPNFVINGYVYV